MSFTRQDWAIAYLNGLGNAHPTQNVINWVINWTAAEGGSVGGQGQFNLLNTTQTEPGSTNFNHLSGGGGVQNFTSFQQGIDANVKVTENGLYPDLLAALRNNDETALGFGGMPSSGVMHGLSTWCGGCGYGGWFAHQKPSSNWLNQVFSGTPTFQPGGGTIGSPLGGIANTLGSSSSSTNPSFLGIQATALEQILIGVFGGIIIVVGITVVFFANKSGSK